MMRQLLTRKLLVYALYAATVTALPVAATLPAARFVAPLLVSESKPAPCAQACEAPYPCDVNAKDDAPCHCRDWWSRGPVRRVARAVACLLSRPWRN